MTILRIQAAEGFAFFAMQQLSHPRETARRQLRLNVIPVQRADSRFHGKIRAEHRTIHSVSPRVPFSRCRAIESIRIQRTNLTPPDRTLAWRELAFGKSCHRGPASRDTRS